MISIDRQLWLDPLYNYGRLAVVARSLYNISGKLKHNTNRKNKITEDEGDAVLLNMIATPTNPRRHSEDAKGIHPIVRFHPFVEMVKEHFFPPGLSIGPGCGELVN